MESKISEPLMSGLTLQEINEVVIYDPATGFFTRKNPNYNVRNNGRSGWIKNNGYRCISIKNRQFHEHRLAWFIMTGEIPKEDIDHIDGNRVNNSFCNLRKANRAMNMGNIAAHKDSKSGYKGVFYSKFAGKWASSIKGKHLGYFSNKHDAALAYNDAAKLAYGDYARLNEVPDHQKVERSKQFKGVA